MTNKTPDLIGELLPFAAALFGNRKALAVGDREMGFAELNRLASQAAHGLEKRGVKPGDVVSIYAANSVEWIIAFHAAFRVGACVNPVNVMLTPEEVEYVWQDCDAVVALGTVDKLEPLATTSVFQSLRAVIGFDGSLGTDIESLDSVLEGQPEEYNTVVVDQQDTAMICYTSGTTGHPKGAMHSHRGVVLNTKLTALMHGRSSDDVAVNALPLPHVYGFVVMNAAFLVGMKLVMHPVFDPGEMLKSVARHRATVLEGVPTMYMLMLEHAAIESAELSSLRMCSVGGQTMPIPKMVEVEERFGCPLIELWGMTELAGLGTTFSHLGPFRHGSIGVPMPYIEARIVDAEDATRELPADEPGELMIRGPVVMQGYFGNEAATRETIEPDGWMHTGDIASRDADGFIHIVDRKKDMILTAGYNVYPAEIERALAGHPAVALAAVGPVADEKKGELAKAYIVLKDGVEADESEVIAFCREKLAAYKAPRLVRFVDDLPRTSSGKVMRRKLHELDD